MVAGSCQLAKTATLSSVACLGSSSSASCVSAFRRTTTTSAPSTAVTAATTNGMWMSVHSSIFGAK